jgi:hypothetical protein
MDGISFAAAQIPIPRPSRVAAVVHCRLNFAFYSTGKVRNTG